MRCKKHGTDLTSIDGVCASCLQERLHNLILAQEQQLQAQSEHPNLNSNLTVPRSVSPYISRRTSISSVNPVPVATTTLQRPYRKPYSQSDKRFYNSPQIALNTGGCIGGRSSSTKKLIRFPSISKLFRSSSRNGDADSNPRVSVSTSSERSGAGGRTSSVRVRDRGMSPVRGEDEVSDEYGLTESCKQTPKKTPTVWRGAGQKSVTMILCPMVRASPNRIVNVKGKPPVDDMKASPAVPHLAYAKSFSANRSRKLVDFGRSDSKR